ncbi:hypothetical protein [Kordiimonas sp.]|uniref:hypothetical protein n=1 Tax=Kordiimonas sp. TaxID=1970157 RepID=UPI003B520515
MAVIVKQPWEYEFTTEWDQQKAADAKCGLCAHRCGNVKGLYQHLYDVHRIGSDPNATEGL